MGECIAVLWGHADCGSWPVASARWWSPPRLVRAAEASTTWSVERSPECRAFQARLTVLRALRAGDVVTVVSQRHVRSGTICEPYEVTFDGAARTIRGPSIAGAVAVLWGRADERGGRQELARALVALPGEVGVTTAEAWGLRSGLQLLCEYGGEFRRARIAGDNVNVVRHGASEGRLRERATQSLLEEPLARARQAGWVFAWSLIPRRQNAAADTAAGEAARMAARLAEAGEHEPRIVTRFTAHGTVCPTLPDP